jgi:zinc transport system substrate-binding protein
MKLRIYFIYILVLILICMSGCVKSQGKNDNNKIIIAVSIVPQETFVRSVAGDLVDIVTMIPPGLSPANYQPDPKQMTELSDARLYFSIGVPTEKANILPKIKDFNKEIKIIHLDDIVGNVYPHREFEEHEDEKHEDEDHDDEENEGHSHEGKDPHIWLSPKRVKIMIETIRDELIKLDPSNKEFYTKNASDYIEKLNELDMRIKNSLKNIKNKTFIIYHPSYGYFADDYGMNMMAIEEDGKEVTSKRLKEIIDYAKKEGIKFVFYQEEFDSNQAETIAKEAGGTTIKAKPLSAEYIESMIEITEKFKEILE